MERESVRADIRRRAFQLFEAEALASPPMTLRGGYAVSFYDSPPAPDPILDKVTDAYLEEYTFWGLAHLDPVSWRHYLPVLVNYSLLHPDDPRMVVEGLLHNLRPPDRDPPRLASLTPGQESVVLAFLEEVAFCDDSANQEFAMQVLEEWWIPNSLYRQREGDAPENG